MKVKGFVGYVCSAGLAVLFALYLSGRIGWFLLAVFIIAPLLGGLIMLLSARGLSLSLESPATIYSKGQAGSLNLSLKKRGRLAVCPVQLVIEHSPNISCSQGLIYLMPGDEYSLSFRAEGCGKGYIGVKAAFVKDFTGAFSCKLRGFNPGRELIGLSVMPDVAKINNKNVIWSAIYKAAMETDASDNEESVTLTAASGIAGYDLRDYTPGDPLKRINWKQSVKRNRLLVRLDERVQAFSFCLVLDSYPVAGYSLPEEKALERMLEHYLALAKIIVDAGYSVSCFYYMAGSLKCYKVSEPKHIDGLRIILADYEQAEAPEERLPMHLLAKDRVVIFCTGDATFKGNGLNLLIYYPMGEVQGNG